MLCTRIPKMIYFKVHKKPNKKTMLLTRDKYVWRLVGNQHTALGRTEGKLSEGSKHSELGI